MPTAVTALPGTRGCARGRWSGWSPAPRLDPDIKNYFQDSSIGARRAGGEARFEALTTFSCAQPAESCNALETRRVLGTALMPRAPAPPGPTFRSLFTPGYLHISHLSFRPAAPRPPRTRHTQHARQDRPGRHVSCHRTPGRLTFKSVGHAECPHTITLPHGEFLNMTST